MRKTVWDVTGFFESLWLAVRAPFARLLGLRGGLMAIASDWYSIAGNAKAHLRGPYVRGAWKYLWLALGGTSATLALALAHLCYRDTRKLSSEELDILQSIFRNHPFWPNAEKARFCIHLGLKKSRRPHTKALLLLGSADLVWRRKRDKTEVARRLDLVLEFATMAIKEEEPPLAQISRIFRHMSEMYAHIGAVSLAQVAEKTAIRYAFEARSRSQILKSGAMSRIH